MRVELSLIAAEDLVRKNVFAAREVWQPHCKMRSRVFLDEGDL